MTGDEARGVEDGLRSRGSRLQSTSRRVLSLPELRETGRAQSFAEQSSVDRLQENTVT